MRCQMISVDEAQRLILTSVVPTSVQGGSMGGQALAEPLVATLDSPPYDTSAVDGYGVRRHDLPGRLRLAGYLPAGGGAWSELGPGEAVRILTGGVVPPGVDGVVMQEDCTVENGWVTIERVPERDNIRRRGEEYRRGDTVLRRGQAATPPVMGLVAANGLTEYPFRRAPRVRVLVTGDELRAPGKSLEEGCLYASNGVALTEAARRVGAEAEWCLLPDDADALRQRIELNGDCDVLITTGGVSVGDRDYTKVCLEAAGVRPVFWKVRLKPGKPVFFGLREGQAVFGLPGSPVAALLTFRLFVAPALRRMLGLCDVLPTTFPAQLGASIGKRPGRAEYVAATLDTAGDVIVAHPLSGRGAHAANKLAVAQALIHLPEDAEDPQAGDVVRIEPLTW